MLLQEMAVVAVDRDEAVILCCAQEAELKSALDASERAAQSLDKLQQDNGENL